MTITDLEGTTQWEAAAQALLDETGVSVAKFRSSMSGIALYETRRIETPRPRGALSFAVFAHEIGHHVLHRDGKRRPRYTEEVEAWEFALAQFKRFGIPCPRKVRARAVRSILYAFHKAERRGAKRADIRQAHPKWWAKIKAGQWRM